MSKGILALVAAALALSMGGVAHAQNQPVQVDQGSCTSGAVPVWVASPSGTNGGFVCSSSKAASALPSAPGGALLPNLTLPHLPSNAVLTATPSTAYTTFVRDGFAVAGDAPPLTFIPSASACSANAGAGDGGSQVPTSDGKCWLAVFPDTGRNILEFGASSGATAAVNSAAIQAAINSMVIGGDVVCPAASIGYQFSTGLTIGNGNGTTHSTVNGIRLRGTGAGTGAVAGGASAPCELIYTGGSGTGLSIKGPIYGWGLKDIELYSQTPTAGSIGLLTTSASWGNVENLLVANFETDIKETIGTVIALRNSYRQVHAFMPASLANAIGISISGTATTDQFFDTWDQVDITPAATTHTALYLGALDSCNFRSLQIYPAAAKGIVFDYSLNPAWPSGCYFNQLDVYNNTITNVGSPTISILDNNKMFAFSQINGATIPAIANLRMMDSVYPARTRIYLTGAQSIANAGTVVTLDTVAYDTDGIADTTNHRIKPIRPGVYHIRGQVTAASGGATSNLYCLSENAALSVVSQSVANNSGVSASAVCQNDYTFNGTTDYVNLVSQITGGSTAVTTGANNTWLEIEGPLQ